MVIDSAAAPLMVDNGRPAAAQSFGTRRDPVAMRVTESRALSKRVLQLTLTREDGRDIAFKPGQFCNVAIPGADGDVWRSYSIATPAVSGAASPVCEIAVAAVPGGAATEYLFSRRPGDSVRVSGPLGRLLLPPEDPAHYLLIGTGTGMAPYRAMLPELERRAATQPLRVTLLMGVRSRGECIYGGDFLDFVRRAPELRRFLVCYSRDMPAAQPSHERAGYVQDALRELPLAPGQDRVYLCGNPDMIDDCSRALTERGIDKSCLVREKYRSSPSPR